MNKRNLQPKRALRSVLLVLLLSAVGMTNVFAQNHDFTSVAPNGQTLYYKITDATQHTVMVTHPNDNTSSVYVTNYGNYNSNDIRYYNNPYFNYLSYSSYNGLTYHYYDKPSGNLIIPYYVEYNGISYSVSAIDEYAFGTTYNSNCACNGLTSVVIPASVKTIGKQAFARCTGLTTVTIPTSVTSIGDEVFRYCSNLVTVNFNATNCSSVGVNTWNGCSNITNLNIGNTVIRIPSRGFQGMATITSVSLPNRVATIGDYGFDGCTSLSIINLPNLVTSIGNYAFNGCSSLQSTTESQLLPENLVTIGDYAFQNASNLAYIHIPSTVNSIGKYAFKNCTALNMVDYEATSCTYSGTQAEPPFFYCSALATITVSDNVTQIPSYCFKDCTPLTNLTLNNGLTTVGTYGFFGCQNLSSLVIPASVDSIGSFAFGNEYDIQIGYVESKNPTPPVIGGVMAFPAGQTIHVPAISLDEYEGAAYWNEYDLVGTETTYYEITATATPTAAGAASGAGLYEQGTTCTVTALPNGGYSFVNWTENNVVVSTDAAYSFTVEGNRALVAHFAESGNYWEPEIEEYEDNMTLTCIVQLDGIEQATTMLEVGAFCGTECRGSQSATYFPPTNRYIIQMTIFGEANDVISFRLYDHEQNQELQLTPPAAINFATNGYGSLFNPYVLNFTSTLLIAVEANPAGAGTITGAGNYVPGAEVTLTAVANTGYEFANWTLNGVVVSTNASYSFTATEVATYVANFSFVHTQTLSSGWNWWSTYVELDNNNGLNQLENSIGSAGIIIKSRTNGYVEAYEYNGGTYWYGTLNSINNEQMYKIRTNEACEATVTGALALTANHPITIKNGWNWIGFPCNQDVSVDVAMSNFTPENNDVIKGRTGFTTYYSDNNYNMWYGTLNTLEVGKGYMYRSNSTTQKTLVFQTGRGETTMENVTTEDNIFQPADGDFADNMTITAVLELDGEELRSDDYELAAFVGDECRGSVKLMYVEPVNRFVAFLTVFGEPSETLYFRLTDGTQTEMSMDEITFAADGMEGTLSEPMTLRFGTTKLDENEWSKVLVYPNPSNGVFNIQGQGIRKIEVFNAFGQAVVSEETGNDHLQIDLSRYADGCYMLRVVTDNGISNRQLIKR